MLGEPCEATNMVRSSGYNLSNSGNHFEHTFGSIGHTGAEIRPVKGLSNNLFNFSSFYVSQGLGCGLGCYYSEKYGVYCLYRFL